MRGKRRRSKNRLVGDASIGLGGPAEALGARVDLADTGTATDRLDTGKGSAVDASLAGASTALLEG